MAPTNAHILLSAVQAAIEADIARLQSLSRRHTLNPELVLRILLTFLPESTDPSTYLPLLQDLASGLPELRNGDDSQSHATGNEEKEYSPEEARRRAKSIRLLPLTVEDHIEKGAGDSLPPYLVTFILARARRIDLETGSLTAIQQLVEPFVEHSAYLKLWMSSVIVPLLRLNYDIYSEREEPITLEAFEHLRGGSALDTLVGGGAGGILSVEEYVRDLNRIVGPWLQGEVYRRTHRKQRTAGAASQDSEEDSPAVVVWGWVNNWLLYQAEKDYGKIVSVVCDHRWNGPASSDDGGWVDDDQRIAEWIWASPSVSTSKLFRQVQDNISRTCISLFYTAQEATEETFEILESLLTRTAERSEHGEEVKDILHSATPSHDLSEEFLTKVKGMAHGIRTGELLQPLCPLTDLSIESFVFAAWYLKFSVKLLGLDTPVPLFKTVQMALLGTPAEQRSILQRYLQIVGDKKVDDSSCTQLWENVSLLRTRPAFQTTQGASSAGVWGQLGLEETSLLFLKSAVTAGRFQLVTGMYLTGSSALSKEEVEDGILSVALSTFDSATNGNRTRGGMKKTSDIVNAFAQHFAGSTKFARLEALLRATHALSFYSLTLQHGVSCAPVNIRTQKQPLSLIDKVLAQNKDAYTSLDDLTRIGSDLVRSGLVIQSSGQLAGNPAVHSQPSPLPHSVPSFFSTDLGDLDSTLQMVTQAVGSKAIRASLDAADFDTAYSYITTRLSGRTKHDTWEAVEDENTLWRTALAAGRFEPRNEARSGPKYLRRLEQKMELLASALELAPPPALAQVLEAWQECEAQVNAATAKETEAEMAWDDGGDKRSSMRLAAGDRHLPGGFGAEAWIPNAEGTGGRKWTGGEEEAPMGLFDVARGAAAALQKSAFASKGARGGSASQSVPRGHGIDDGDAEHEGPDRVRKRDMVSNAVTSGLVSGIGWVIADRPT